MPPQPDVNVQVVQHVQSAQNIKLFANRYGDCFECGIARIGSGWCKICEIKALVNNFCNWTSGNEYLDYVIRTTQESATESVDFLEWIPWERFILTEYLGKGAFSTVYSSYWLEGPRWIWDEEGESWLRNGPIKVAIKRIDNSHNITNKYLDEILRYHKCIQNGSVADCFGMTRDTTGCYAFIMRFYENGNLYEYLDHSMGVLCWRDIVDMLWGISGGLHQIHKENLCHGNLHGGNLLVENEPESIDTRIADVGLHSPADELYETLGDWVTAICDNPDPSPLSDQFDAAEEKKFADFETKAFLQPKTHPQAKYTSQPIYFPELLD
ncbi:14718_t:CDS:2 [Acaulospora morrowiae]|uniref:14718_t:CDS:1 n=1 Tax=Acaulospora morrowiae TaxID=94023 RepID=A0A9N9FAW8_9GLOM|nr:14718_t:CDS:2 [Acaulospora morrowiae]